MMSLSYKDPTVATSIVLLSLLFSFYRSDSYRYSRIRPRVASSTCNASKIAASNYYDVSAD